MRSTTATERVKTFVREHGLVRPRDLKEAGLPSPLLYRLRDRGELLQLAPGLFMHPDLDITEKHTYAEVAKLVPRGVICLLSVLAFHQVGVQVPHRVWVALNRDEVRTTPRVEGVQTKFLWFSGPAFHEGQEVHEVEGVEVRVYCLAKTVADLFKYRKKVGVSIAIEALHEGWRERPFTMDELMDYAEICRVKTVMRPYIQSLVAAP